MITKPYLIIYTPNCCYDNYKGNSCIHEKHELTYHYDTLKQAKEAKSRVGGKIYFKEGEELIEV